MNLEKYLCSTTADTDPFRHLVSVRHPVVIVEDHDGGDAAGGDHEHDCREICP